MASLKLGKDQSGDTISKEKLKEASKPASGRSTKKLLPLLPTQNHQVITSSALLSPSITITPSMSSSSSPSIALTSSSSSSSIALSSSSSSSALTAMASSSSSPIATLHELLNNIVGQRNQILGLINAVDPSFLGSVSPKSLQEHKLLNQVTELQGRILAVSEEIHHMRAKNAQLEHQLSSFRDKRATS